MTTQIPHNNKSSPPAAALAFPALTPNVPKSPNGAGCCGFWPQIAALAFSFSRSLIDFTPVEVVPVGLLDEPRDIDQRSSKLPEGFVVVVVVVDGVGDVTLERITGEGAGAALRDVCGAVLGDNTPIPIPKPVLLESVAAGCCEYDGFEACVTAGREGVGAELSISKRFGLLVELVEAAVVEGETGAVWKSAKSSSAGMQSVRKRISEIRTQKKSPSKPNEGRALFVAIPAFELLPPNASSSSNPPSRSTSFTGSFAFGCTVVVS
jgi:hypothetical protein